MGNPVPARTSLIGAYHPHHAIISSKPTNNLVTHLKNFEKGSLQQSLEHMSQLNKTKSDLAKRITSFEKGCLQRSLEHMSQLNKTKTALAKRITSFNEILAKLPEAVIKIITKLK